MWKFPGQGTESAPLQPPEPLKIDSFFYYYIFLTFRAAPVAYGSSQARDRVGAVAASHNHSKARSRLCLRSTAKLRAMPDP